MLLVPLCAGAGEWVRFEGLTDAALIKQLRGVCSLEQLADTETFTDAWLQRKAEKDKVEMLEILRANGFHDAEVSSSVGHDDSGRHVVFTVEAGAPYEFDAPTLDYTAKIDTETAAQILGALPVRPGEPALAQKILDAEKLVLDRLRQGARPFARIADRKVVVDRRAKTVHVAWSVDPDEACHFGKASVDGLSQVAESVVFGELPWKPGEAYTQKLLDKGRNRLLKTGLFSVVELEPVKSGTPGVADVNIHIVERKPRSVALGLEYRTEEGPGLHALWEHRNVRGIGHHLELRGDLSTTLQNFSAKYDMPRFHIPEQTLSFRLKGTNDNPDAYESRAVDASVWLERKFGETFTAGTGLSLRYSHVRQEHSFDNFLLVSVPAEGVYDTRNDRLNPTSGIRTSLRMEPYYDLAGSNALFLKNDWTIIGIQSLAPPDDWVLAGRLRLGATAGESLYAIPADIRFYAGGGGSIRGFGYQKAGQLDCSDNPIGGRSVAEWTIEMRKKITDRIGLALFVDGGSAFASTFPDFSSTVFWGGGVGLRYFTPVGPIRFDIAAPINPRSHVDAPLQFYVSVGQAF